MSDLTNIIGGFNAAEHEDLNDDSPLPEGVYYLEVEKLETKQTANGQGVGANAQFDVLGEKDNGSHQGRKVFNWFNLQHSNETAQKIGQAEFASLCKAVGVMAPKDTDELIGGRFLAKIGIDKKDASKNVIKKYMPIDDAPAAPVAAPAPTQPEPVASGAAKKMPWEK